MRRLSDEYQGFALFGPSMVICIKAANGHRVIRDMKTSVEFMNRIGYKD